MAKVVDRKRPLEKEEINSSARVDSERGIRRQKVEGRAVATEVWSVVGGEMGSSNESKEGEEMRREVGREQSGDTSLKRRREEEAETSGGNRAQSSGRMTARARVGGGKRGKQAPRVVRLAEATTATQGGAWARTRQG